MKSSDNKKKRTVPTRTLSMTALFASLSIVFGYIEHLIPFDFGIPGVKLGLSNLIIVIMLYTFSWRQAFFVLLVRIFVSSILFGNIYSLGYSLAGGILSFAVMCLIKHIKGFSFIGVSISGGVSHNIGQLIVAVWALNSPNIALYLPVLLISGAVTGALIGIIASPIINRLKKADLVS